MRQKKKKSPRPFERKRLAHNLLRFSAAAKKPKQKSRTIEPARTRRRVSPAEFQILLHLLNFPYSLKREEARYRVALTRTLINSTAGEGRGGTGRKRGWGKPALTFFFFTAEGTRGFMGARIGHSISIRVAVLHRAHVSRFIISRGREEDGWGGGGGGGKRDKKKRGRDPIFVWHGNYDYLAGRARSPRVANYRVQTAR